MAEIFFFVALKFGEKPREPAISRPCFANQIERLMIRKKNLSANNIFKFRMITSDSITARHAVDAVLVRDRHAGEPLSDGRFNEFFGVRGASEKTEI